MDQRPSRYEYDEDNKDHIRDRTISKPRAKRRFDSGPDPEKVKQELLSAKQQEMQKQSSGMSQTFMSSGTVPNRYGSGNTNDKHAKRAYLGNIPSDTDPIDLEAFLNISLRNVGACLDPGNPILNSSFINLDKRFMFVELRSVEETTLLMKLDGIKYRGHYLKIRRPVDYDKNPVIPPTRPLPELDLSKLGIISTQVEESDLKLFVGGLSGTLDEDQIKSILLRYGKLKSFHLVKEADGIRSKGYAF